MKLHPQEIGAVINYTIPGDDIHVRIYSPLGSGPFPITVYFHGGGFVFMGLDTHDGICRQICAGSNTLTVSVDYKLAPKHPYPEGPDSCITAIRWIHENAAEFNGIAGRMAVSGDSAGGYMALYAAQKLTTASFKLMAQFAAYPVTDHYSGCHPSWNERQDGDVLTAKAMKWYWDKYLRDPAKFEEASPLRAKDFSGLPPALIMTCTFDPLRDEGKAYATRLIMAGVETIHLNFENTHGFFGLGNMGAEAMEVACRFLHAKLYS